MTGFQQRNLSCPGRAPWRYPDKIQRRLVTYADAIQFLYGLQLFGSQFGLERAHRLAELAGNPQNKLRSIR